MRATVDQPWELETTVLRQTEDPEIYEQKVEHWRKLGEMSPDGVFPKKLLSSKGTGRKYRLCRSFSLEAFDDKPSIGELAEGETVAFVEPDFTVSVYEQIAGTPNDIAWGVRWIHPKTAPCMEILFAERK